LAVGERGKGSGDGGWLLKGKNGMVAKDSQVQTEKAQHAATEQ